MEMHSDAYPDVLDVDSFIAGKLDAVHVQLVLCQKDTQVESVSLLWLQLERLPTNFATMATSRRVA